jgi:hypothetical protein
VSFGSVKVFEDYARDCVNRAKQADSPELRDMLLDIAREWMQIATDEEDWAKRITDFYRPHAHPTAG